MKKVIVSILIIATILNLIQPITSFATDDTTDTTNTINKEDAQAEYDALLNSEEREIISAGRKRNEKVTFAPTGGAVVANILANLISTVVSVIPLTLSAVVSDSGDMHFFTIYDVVFGEMGIFDANYLLDNGNNNDIHVKIKEQVALWYNAIRKIAIVLSLCVLLYMGIRMAISTLAEDKAKYKKMLIGWIQSFILIFFMHYIILISMVLSDSLLNIIKSMTGAGQAEGNFIINALFNAEFNITINLFKNAFLLMGWDAVSASIAFWLIVFFQVKFFMLYAKRMLSVAFLIIIAPLITVTYPIDKAGDGKAQAFTAWFKEFEVNMFIQPLHALLYVVFIVSASEIASRAPLLAALFFMGLSRGEKVMKEIFEARGMKSINSMDKGKRGKKII